MARSKAVCDTGPPLHLSQVGSLNLLAQFEVWIPPEVARELAGHGVRMKGHPEAPLSPTEKNRAAQVAEKFRLQLREAEAIALAEARGVRLLLTDDLEARRVAADLGLEPHGTIGVVLRAHREGLLDREEAGRKIRDLQARSSLFLTSELVRRVLEELKRTR